MVLEGVTRVAYGMCLVSEAENELIFFGSSSATETSLVYPEPPSVSGGTASHASHGITVSTLRREPTQGSCLILRSDNHAKPHSRQT